MNDLELFKKKATAVSMILAEAKDLAEAMQYAVDVCERKAPCELLASPSENRAGGAKIMAAPALSDENFAEFKKLGEAKGFSVLREGMRDNLAGIDVALTLCDMAIADTATCVLPSASEELRIATMICEEHIVVLPKSKIVRNSSDAIPYLKDLMSNGPTYTAFISGASRTSDIERVLTLGVHGPLVMHVVLVEG